MAPALRHHPSRKETLSLNMCSASLMGSTYRRMFPPLRRLSNLHASIKQTLSSNSHHGLCLRGISILLPLRM